MMQRHLANRGSDGPAPSLLTYYPKSLEALSPVLALALILTSILQDWPDVVVIIPDLRSRCWALSLMRQRLQNKTINGCENKNLARKARHPGASYGVDIEYAQGELTT
jgi:hypothetical protein